MRESPVLVWRYLLEMQSRAKVFLDSLEKGTFLFQKRKKKTSIGKLMLLYFIESIFPNIITDMYSL